MAEPREPAPGDIVTLHSGGPDLTVLRVYSDDGSRVADLGWFTAAGEYRTGTLPLAVLRSRAARIAGEPPWARDVPVDPPRPATPQIRALRPPGGR